jgi:hypothetical protein
MLVGQLDGRAGNILCDFKGNFASIDFGMALAPINTISMDGDSVMSSLWNRLYECYSKTCSSANNARLAADHEMLMLAGRIFTKLPPCTKGMYAMLLELTGSDTVSKIEKEAASCNLTELEIKSLVDRFETVRGLICDYSFNVYSDDDYMRHFNDDYNGNSSAPIFTVENSLLCRYKKNKMAKPNSFQDAINVIDSTTNQSRDIPYLF